MDKRRIIGFGTEGDKRSKLFLRAVLMEQNKSDL